MREGWFAGWGGGEEPCVEGVAPNDVDVVVGVAQGDGDVVGGEAAAQRGEDGAGFLDGVGRCAYEDGAVGAGGSVEGRGGDAVGREGVLGSDGGDVGSGDDVPDGGGERCGRGDDEQFGGGRGCGCRGAGR